MAAKGTSTTSITFPIDISPNLTFAFTAKEVQLVQGSDDLAAATKKALLKSADNTGGRKTLAQNLLEGGTTVATIVLPIPNGFVESVKHDWSETTGLAASAVDAVMSSLSSLSKTAVKAIQQTAGNTGVRMVATDPGYFQKYSGTKTRTFSFAWDFVIESKADATIITDLIKNFKIYSAPSQLVSNVALIAPNFWLVQINNTTLRDSLMLQPMVVTDVAVNYAGSNIMEIYKDGTPKFINLSISMSEISA
ncbi:MAG: baseplate tail-tube junction protein, partial [Lentimicrobium sp.]|nr:baseplate tail-tube junction protein [Lentimicrobium sp.]